MTEEQRDLGQELLLQLTNARDKKGRLTLQDVSDIFAHIAGNPAMASNPADIYMHEEISRLAQYITDAKREIFAISANDKSSIVDASQHLDAVIKATEEASNTIMDAADAIQNAASGIGGDKEQQIVDATTRIYEACNFQDISGQRLTKVIRLLTHIEERIVNLNNLFGATPQAANPANDTAKPAAAPTDEDLLNGPQLNAASQADIDALFASGNK